MEAKSFIKLLRKVIREEVQSVVRKEVRLLLKEQSSKPNHQKVIDHGMHLSEIADSPKTTPVTNKKTFTKNPMLNDLLNDTANTPPTQELTDWSKMDYKSSMAESFGVERKNRAIAQSLATHDINGAPINMADENVAKTVNVMTKDYSQLMAAIDKKKGN
jgi:hypothetical protein